MIEEEVWVGIRSYDSRKLETRGQWMDIVPEKKWGYRDHVLNGYRDGALGSTIWIERERVENPTMERERIDKGTRF